MIYVLSPEVFDYFPDQPVVDFALDVFPALLEHDVPFFVHETDGYWNDVGSPPEYLQGNLDVARGVVGVEPAGELVEAEADASEPGEHALGAERGGLPADCEVDGRVLVGAGARIGSGVRIDGPAVIGAGSVIGDGARLKRSLLLPGAEVSAGGFLVDAIAGRTGALV
jgi:NDP-sugar pyrophosphorylase family protein